MTDQIKSMFKILCAIGSVSADQLADRVGSDKWWTSEMNVVTFAESAQDPLVHLEGHIAESTHVKAMEEAAIEAAYL